MESKSWIFLYSWDIGSFKKSQVHETDLLWAEPVCPFLHTPWSNMLCEKHKAALWKSRNLPIPKELYWSAIAAAVQMIQAPRKVMTHSTGEGEAQSFNGECLSCWVWFLQEMYGIQCWEDSTGCVWVLQMAQDYECRAREHGACYTVFNNNNIKFFLN